MFERMEFEIINVVKPSTTSFTAVLSVAYFWLFYFDLMSAEAPCCVESSITMITKQWLFYSWMILMSLDHMSLQVLPPMVTAITLSALEFFDALVSLNMNS
jgi:hypothetical protein